MNTFLPAVEKPRNPMMKMVYDNSRKLHQMGELNTSFRELAA